MAQRRASFRDRRGKLCWFEVERAQRYDEALNELPSPAPGYVIKISRATGEEQAHERLWLTDGGQWVLESWATTAGNCHHGFDRMAPDVARQWLIENEHDDVVTEVWGPVAPEYFTDDHEWDTVTIELGDRTGQVIEFAASRGIDLDTAVSNLVDIGLGHECLTRHGPPAAPSVTLAWPPKNPGDAAGCHGDGE